MDRLGELLGVHVERRILALRGGGVHEVRVAVTDKTPFHVARRRRSGEAECEGQRAEQEHPPAALDPSVE